MLVAIVLSVGFYLNVPDEESKDVLYMEDHASPDVNQAINQNRQAQDETKLTLPDTGLSVFIGKNVAALKSSFGEPSRIDPSSFGYDWWIYNKEKQYVQVGVENDTIVTLYAIGEKVEIPPFKIGQSVEELFSKVSINPDINLEYAGTSYRFEMSEEDINTRPIVKMGNIYVQLNIDKFTGLLSSIRYFDGKSLVIQRPYELVYRGQLLETTVNEENWEKIEAASRRQIFELTNIMRAQFDLNILKWDEQTAEVAYLHSKDMSETNTFSHNSEQFGELADRLKTGNIQFELAGENIAANYLDAPSVMQGWLNSIGHRKSLLNEKFTHSGVGVFKKYFTQDFIKKQGEAK